MKKIIALFLTSIFLIGCQDSQVETEQEKVSEVDTRTVYESNSKPRYIRLNGVEPKLLSYCWNEDLTTCSSEIPKVTENEFDGYRTNKAPSSTNIKLSVDPDPMKTLPFPDIIEIFQVSGEEIIPVTNTDNSFTLPVEEGVYTYVFKTIYDADIKGIAFYGFQQRVKN